MTENPYIKQFPDLMAGKTVLYVHGFASSGQSGTVTRLRTVMPQAKVISPDLPVNPHEAIALLHTICEKLGFDSLGYQSLDSLLEAIGIDRDKICTYCWNGKE